MSATLSSFQSAVQLVAGANLAIFALPKLGLEEFEIEERRWSAAVRAAETTSPQQQLAVHRGRSEFQMRLTELEEKRGWVRSLALFSSLEAAGYLVWMSAFPEHGVDVVTVGTLIVGVIPTVNLFAHRTEASQLLRDSRAKRLAA